MSEGDGYSDEISANQLVSLASQPLTSTSPISAATSSWTTQCTPVCRGHEHRIIEESILYFPRQGRNHGATVFHAAHTFIVEYVDPETKLKCTHKAISPTALFQSNVNRMHKRQYDEGVHFVNIVQSAKHRAQPLLLEGVKKWLTDDCSRLQPDLRDVCSLWLVSETDGWMSTAMPLSLQSKQFYYVKDGKRCARELTAEELSEIGRKVNFKRETRKQNRINKNLLKRAAGGANTRLNSISLQLVSPELTNQSGEAIHQSPLHSLSIHALSNGETPLTPGEIGVNIAEITRQQLKKQRVGM